MLSFHCNLFRYSVVSHCQYIYNWHIWPWIIVAEISDLVHRVRLRNNITMFSLNSGKFVQIGDCFNKAGSWNKKGRWLNAIAVKVWLLFCFVVLLGYSFCQSPSSLILLLASTSLFPRIKKTVYFTFVKEIGYEISCIRSYRSYKIWL